jgi:glyoxalase family protein
MKHAGPMKLVGLHHITMITSDAQRNVGFYADVLGLRLVKKTVNFDDPTAYHLYFGDEQGSPGSILTLVRVPGRTEGPGRRGDDPHDRTRRRLARGA